MVSVNLIRVRGELKVLGRNEAVKEMLRKADQKPERREIRVREEACQRS